MEVQTKKFAGKAGEKGAVLEKRPKSKIMRAREKYPEGIGYIANLKAVLK
jgi:hypothetical protein